MPRNQYDTFHGTREAANNVDNTPKMVIGYIKTIDSKNVCADVYIPEQNSVLKNVPISFNFMNFASGNIAFPEVDSPVIVVNSGTIKPFILCSTGKLRNYSVNSDLLESEQVFSVPSLQFTKYAKTGDILSAAADGSYVYIGKDGKIIESSYDKERRTFGTLQMETQIDGNPISYKRIYSIPQELREASYSDFLTNNELNEWEENRVLTQLRATQSCVSDFWKDIRQFSIAICDGNLMDYELTEDFLSRMGALFDSIAYEKDTSAEVLIQEGSAVSGEYERISDLSALTEEDLENLSKGDPKNEHNNKTIYKISMRESDGTMKEKFAVTEKGARIVEGNIADRFQEESTKP